MRYLIAIVLICGLMTHGYAQNARAKQKIEAARIALITERLNLTPKEAENFWPIYNEFTSQRRALKNEFREKRYKENVDQLSDNQRKEILQNEITLKQKRLNLEKEYSQRVLNVISTKQVMSLRTAEKDFKTMLIQRVQQSRNLQMREKKHLKQRHNN